MAFMLVDGSSLLTQWLSVCCVCVIIVTLIGGMYPPFDIFYFLYFFFTAISFQILSMFCFVSHFSSELVGLVWSFLRILQFMCREAKRTIDS